MKQIAENPGISVMEMHQIRYFIALVEHLNFTRAAEDCGVAQPSLTRAIRLLEEELGGRLFSREGRMTHLTEFGKRIRPHLEDGYARMQGAKDVARSIRKGEREPLVVALSTTIDAALLAGALRELHRSFPKLEVRLSRYEPGGLLGALKEGQADLAVAANLPEVWERLDHWHLFSDEISMVVSKDHKFANRASVRSDEIASERIIMRPYCEMRQEIVDRIVDDPIDIIQDEVCTDEDALFLVEMNVGVAFLPESRRIGPHLRRLRIDDATWARDIRLYTVAGRPWGPAASALLRLLRTTDWTDGGAPL